MQKIVVIGLIITFLGILVTLIGLLASSLQGDGQIKGGAVVFIGPIPIVFGSDRNTAIIVAVLALLLMAAAYFLLKP